MASAALARAQECLLPDTPEERCSLEVMESLLKELNSETVRAECSSSQQADIDDLWRLIKMIYNGATRQEALAARHPEHITGEEASEAYRKVLRFLNPAFSESAECSLADLESACRILGAPGVRTDFTQAQNQVVDQLRKAIQGAKEGDSVQTAIKRVWHDRDNAARSRLLHASRDFFGMYPSGGADAFAQALDFLSPHTPEENCSLEAMESAFRVLDSELVRRECSEAQESVISDLWRLIKMIYNGATRQEALAARQPDQIKDTAVAVAYGKVLLYLNPSSVDSAECSLDDLESAYDVLGNSEVQAEFSDAQNQVIDVLQKAIQGTKGGVSVHTAITKAWSDRDNAARARLK